MRVVRDDKVETTYGFYECPICHSEFPGGGPTLHYWHRGRECPNKDKGYEFCTHHVGPNCREYAQAEK